MKTLVSLAFGLALVCYCSEVFAQCPASGGLVQFRGGGQTGGGGQNFRGSGQASSSAVSYSQGGFRGGRLLTGPGSYFHDLMVENRQRQLIQRQQVTIAAAKQAKKNLRKSKQLETRRAQRKAELVRRETKKREAAVRKNLSGSNQVQLASLTR